MFVIFSINILRVLGVSLCPYCLLKTSQYKHWHCHYCLAAQQRGTLLVQAGQLLQAHRTTGLTPSHRDALLAL